jgi:hypothetical protein
VIKNFFLSATREDFFKTSSSLRYLTSRKEYLRVKKTNCSKRWEMIFLMNASYLSINWEVYFSNCKEVSFSNYEEIVDASDRIRCCRKYTSLSCNKRGTYFRIFYDLESLNSIRFRIFTIHITFYMRIETRIARWQLLISRWYFRWW